MLLSRFAMGAIVATSVAMAHAQPAAPPASSGSAMKLKYESAFSDYLPFTDFQVLSWKQANDDAAAIGGHMGQMKSSMPAMARKPAPETAPPPKTPIVTKAKP